MIGSFVGSTIVGPFADRHDPQLLFLFALPFTTEIIFPILLGHLPESKVVRKNSFGLTPDSEDDVSSFHIDSNKFNRLEFLRFVFYLLILAIPNCFIWRF